MRPIRRLPALLLGCTLLATASAAGCGDSEEEESGGAPAETVTEVTIDDFEFMPAELSVQAGEEITVTNADTAGHTLSADSGDFDTGPIEADGDEGTFTVEEPGTYPFICDFHPTMKGTVTAEE